MSRRCTEAYRGADEVEYLGRRQAHRVGREAVEEAVVGHHEVDDAVAIDIARSFAEPFAVP
jgi:hypothetical protein